jgi:hypothetical protein
MHRSTVVAAALSLALACKERPGPAPEAEPDAPAVDLSGAWAGTWSGTVGGNDITGFWEADIVQSSVQSSQSVTGTAFLSGDIDCPFSTIWGSLAYRTMTGSISAGRRARPTPGRCRP